MRYTTPEIRVISKQWCSHRQQQKQSWCLMLSYQKFATCSCVIWAIWVSNAVLTAFKDLDIRLEGVQHADLGRTHEIATAYADAQFDVVDCIIMSQAERLNISQVATFDRRDFSIFRPKHCDYLTLLP